MPFPILISSTARQSRRCALQRPRHVLAVLAVLTIAPVAWAVDAPPVARPAEPIVYFDMTPLFQLDLNDPIQLRRFYDETFVVASLQGLVNREAPRLYIRYNRAPDDFWWQEMRAEGGWLADRPVHQPGSLADLLWLFLDDIQGAVVWDERVPATSNLAATIAGVEDLIVLRHDPAETSTYRQLTDGLLGRLRPTRRLLNDDGSPLFTGQGKIPGTDLNSTGSPKNDAHMWLVEHFIRTGKTNPRTLGYYIDGFWLQCWPASARQNHTLTNLDYIIAQRGACFDLNVWPDEATVDDPNQKPGTDLETLKTFLRACYDQFDGDGFIHVAGFTPWAYKYTNYRSGQWNAGGKHEPVATEWMYAEILSCFNAYMDADAIGYSAMANASFWQHSPLPDRIAQNPKPTRESLMERGILDDAGRIVARNYYAHYHGDYDSAAWVYWKIPQFWQDPARGQVPMTWAINPNLAQRFPFGMTWLRERRTDNDFFVAGDSGAGYINPAYLTAPRPHSGLPSAVAAWERHCRQFYEQWDLTATGFIIDGNTPGMSPEVWDAYARFSPDGLVPQIAPRPRGLHNGVPYLRMFGDLSGNAERDARVIHSHFVPDRPHFIYYRSILQPPAYYVQIDETLRAMEGPDFMLVDLYTLMWLIREYESHRDLYAQRSPYGSAQRVMAAPGRTEGLTVHQVTDGPYEIQEMAGRSSWVTPATEGWTYLYFSVDEGFLHGWDQPLEVTVTYLDEGTGVLGMTYDSTNAAAPLRGAYTVAPLPAPRAASGTWQTASVALDNALFAGRQNGHADFRLQVNGAPVAIAAVTVEKIGTAAGEGE